LATDGVTPGLEGAADGCAAGVGGRAVGGHGDDRRRRQRVVRMKHWLM
jgi:hypothetical protein